MVYVTTITAEDDLMIPCKFCLWKLQNNSDTHYTIDYF